MDSVVIDSGRVVEGGDGDGDGGGGGEAAVAEGVDKGALADIVEAGGVVDVVAAAEGGCAADGGADGGYG